MHIRRDALLRDPALPVHRTRTSAPSRIRASSSSSQAVNHGVSREWREDKKRLERFIAPKVLQDSAQGFNSGNHPMKPLALKGRELTWTNPALYRSREARIESR